MTEIPDGEPMLYGRDYEFLKPVPMWPSPYFERHENHVVIRRADGVRLYDANWNEVDELVIPVEPCPHIRGVATLGGNAPSWSGRVSLEPEQVTPEQRALPRPSHTPPMWAADPARARRPRKTQRHRRVK